MESYGLIIFYLVLLNISYIMMLMFRSTINILLKYVIDVVLFMFYFVSLSFVIVQTSRASTECTH